MSEFHNAIHCAPPVIRKGKTITTRKIFDHVVALGLAVHRTSGQTPENESPCQFLHAWRFRCRVFDGTCQSRVRRMSAETTRGGSEITASPMTDAFTLEGVPPASAFHSVPEPVHDECGATADASHHLLVTPRACAVCCAARPAQPQTAPSSSFCRKGQPWTCRPVQFRAEINRYMQQRA